MGQDIRINHMQAPRPAAFSLPFKTRFCRIRLAAIRQTGMSRKGTCILSYPSLFLSGRIRQAGKRHGRKIATISLLFPWHLSTMFIHKWVLSYPDAFGVGITRASPVMKKLERVPSRLSLRKGKKPTLLFCRNPLNAGQ